MRIIPAITLSFLVLLLCGFGFFLRTSLTITGGGTGVPLFINAGGSAIYQGADGTVWQADEGFTGGSATSSTQAITNTADPTLFQTARTATPITSITYTAFLSSGGQFKVSEYEAETMPSFVQGTRVQSITLTCDGTQKAARNNFDILLPTGPCGPSTAVGRACVLSDWITCGQAGDNTAHTLVIKFTPAVNSPTVNAISIVPQKNSNLSVPTPTPTPTPSAGPQLVNCVGGQQTGTAISLSLANVGTTNSVTNGLILFHKTVSTDTAITDNQTNTWQNANTTGVNTGSVGCISADYVTAPQSSGPITVTFQPASGTAYNAGVLCSVGNFNTVDVVNGQQYTQSVTNALSSAITPSVGTDTDVYFHYVECSTAGCNPSFSGSSSNNVGALGVPVDINPPTLGGAATNGTLLVGVGSEPGTQSQSTNVQRGFTPTGNTCGGMVALSSAAIPISAITVSCSPNPMNVNSTSTCTAVATLVNGNTSNVTGQATWVSSNTSIVTMSGNIATSSGNTGAPTITATVGSISGQTTLTVQLASQGVFPQLALTGQILNTYTPGNSIWARSAFFSGGANAMSAANAHEGSFNVAEAPIGFYDPAGQGCSAGNFSLGTPGNGVTSPLCTNWHNWYVANHVTPWVNLYNQSPDIGFLGTVIALLGPVPTDISSGGAIQWAYPALTDMTSTLRGVSKGFVGLSGPDEMQQSATDPNAVNAMKGLRPIGSPGSWIPFGPETFQQQDFGGWNTNNPATNYAAADFIESESSNSCPNGLQTDATDDLLCKYEIEENYQRTQVNPGHGGPTALLTITGTSPTAFYPGPNHTGAPFTYDAALGDCSDYFQIGGPLVSTAVAQPIAQSWYAVAHGFAGTRAYFYSNTQLGLAGNTCNVCPNFKAHCSNAPTVGCTNFGGACPGTEGTCQLCQLLQEGMSSAADHTASGSLGQDMWYGQAVSQGLIKTLEPYALQPAAATQPGHAPAGGVCNDGTQITCNGALFSDTYCSSPGDPIVCGARQGNGGFLVTFVNMSQSNHAYTFDPSPYISGNASRQEWALTSSNSHTCGSGFAVNGSGGLSSHYSVANGLSGVYDCSVGETYINGQDTWLPGQTFPAGVAAPTTSTAIGSCSGQMCPNEVDVFLYHP